MCLSERSACQFQICPVGFNDEQIGQVSEQFDRNNQVRHPHLISVF